MLEELSSFLVEAKRNTYAADTREKSRGSRSKSKDLEYKQGSYKYLDSYFGSSDFIGEEVVWYKGNVLWGMNYHGYLLADENVGNIVDCLKEALMNVPVSFPCRGPEKYEKNGYVYTCEHNGDLSRYTGYEKITNGIGNVYELYFHGGLIR